MVRKTAKQTMITESPPTMKNVLFKKPPGAISLEWVVRNIIQNLTKESVKASHNSDCVYEAIKLLLAEAQVSPSVPVGKLDLDEVFEYFKLIDAEEEDFLEEGIKQYPVPEELKTIWKQYYEVLGGGKKAMNEAAARWMINLVLFACIYAERSALENSIRQLSSSEFVTNQNLPAINSLQLSEAATSRALIRPIPTTPRSAAIFSPPESEEEQPKVFFDVGMKETVLRDGKMVNVSGFADYSLGHGKNKTSGNLIIVEAKKPSKLAEAPSQCLAYMAMCHHARLKEDKHNAIVYGVCTDGVKYIFYRIDNHSRVTCTSFLSWKKPSDRQEIYSYFRKMIYTAIRTTPTTSPNKEVHDFSGKDHTKFDFGMAPKYDQHGVGKKAMLGDESFEEIVAQTADDASEGEDQEEDDGPPSVIEYLHIEG